MIADKDKDQEEQLKDLKEYANALSEGVLKRELLKKIQMIEESKSIEK